MKKITAFLLAAALLLLAACGTVPVQNATPDEPDNSTEDDAPVEKLVMEPSKLLSQGYVKEADDGVCFTPAKGGIYNYCPTVMEEKNGVRHIYYCTNKDSRQVYDHIGYRRAVMGTDGAWYYGPESLVLKPEYFMYTNADLPAAYDRADFCWHSLHICDPSVIKGSFKYNGAQYTYLMAVLVCSNPYCLDNEVALAVANAPEGPWTLCDDSVNPVVKCSRKMADWGVGQPDIVSIDGAGKVLLTYTHSALQGAIWQCYDFSDLNNIENLSNMKSPTSRGVKNRWGDSLAFYNAAYAFDKEQGILYMLVEQMPHAMGDEPKYPAQVGTVQILLQFSIRGEDPLQIVKSMGSGASWETVYTVNPDVTGYPRNHNACICRDEYGYVSGDSFDLFVTTNLAGNAGNNETYLWYYRVTRVPYAK